MLQTNENPSHTSVKICTLCGSIWRICPAKPVKGRINPIQYQCGDIRIWNRGNEVYRNEKGRPLVSTDPIDSSQGLAIQAEICVRFHRI